MKFRYFAAMKSVLNALFDRKALTVSWVALQSKRFGSQSIIAVGAIATAYALFLFVGQRFSPDTPNPSHDRILRSRFSSPAPSTNIVIVDIDERSLAQLAPEYGRWPWARNVLADGLQKLADTKPRAMLFNVLLSDKDIRNPEADTAMEFTSALLPNVAYPMLRLNPKNDGISALKISQVLGAIQRDDFSGHGTLAAIVPMFLPMQDRLGIANQRPDSDGIVRKYPLEWKEASFSMPSIVKRTIELAKMETPNVPEQIALNWRNKNGRYIRISFSDILLSTLDTTQNRLLRDAVVVVGISAPGIGQTKGTSVSSIEDDSEILATALDDAIHDTYLRTMPDWLTLLFNICAIWGFIMLAVGNFNNNQINRAFVLGQSGFASITLLSASYTHYLIDLSDSMSFSLAVFSVIKVLQGLENSWSRAKPGLRRFGRKKGQGTLMVISYLEGVLNMTHAKGLRRSLESLVGIDNVVLIDDLFGGESLLKEKCSKYRCLISVATDANIDSMRDLLGKTEFIGKVQMTHHELDVPWDPDDKSFCNLIAPLVILNSASTLGS